MKLKTLLVLFVIAMGMLFPMVALAAPPPNAGSGGPPVVVNENNDPDQVVYGPDRYTDHVSTDWNNGCQGGVQWGEEDDNEGLCGKAPEKNRPTTTSIHHNCTVRLYGRTPEVFDGDVDVRNPDNEQHVRAEANNFLEFHGNDGQWYQVLWYDKYFGHAESKITKFLCEGVIVLYEPPMIDEAEIAKAMAAIQ